MPSNQKSIILSSPRDVYIRYKFLEEYSQEVLVVLLLDNKFRLKKEKVLYQGTSNSFSIKVDEVLKELVLGEAKAFILIHNHPDQTKEPSNHDVIATKTIEKSAKNLSIKLLDHLIIYKGGYYSFKMNK